MLEDCALQWVGYKPLGLLRKKFVKNFEGLAM